MRSVYLRAGLPPGRALPAELGSESFVLACLPAGQMHDARVEAFICVYGKSCAERQVPAAKKVKAELPFVLGRVLALLWELERVSCGTGDRPWTPEVITSLRLIFVKF